MANIMDITRGLMGSADRQRRRKLAVDASKGLAISPEMAMMLIRKGDTVETLRDRLQGFIARSE